MYPLKTPPTSKTITKELNGTAEETLYEIILNVTRESKRVCSIRTYVGMTIPTPKVFINKRWSEYVTRAVILQDEDSVEAI